jgi:cyclopropane fatty-acyl-phospholipid synthase-like methyltransferase
LISQNLKKNHTLLDIGCGTLRDGVKFCYYLDKNNYYGFDKLESFLKIGYEKEIIEKGLQKKLDYKNLKYGSNFDFSYPLDFFDYALSISLFTRLPIEDLEIYLKKLNPFLKVNSCYYSTFVLTDN